MSHELESLSAELQALGGGTARVAKYDVCVLVGPRTGAHGRGGSIVRPQAGGVVVRDPRAPNDAPAAQCERSFSIGTVVDCHDEDPQVAALDEHVSQRVSADLVNGFNCTVVAFGQSGSGKTHALFGSCAWPAAAAALPLLQGVLQHVVELTSIQGFDTFQLGLSCWELVHDQVVDLLAPQPLSPAAANAGGGARLQLCRVPGLSLEHACLKVESLQDVHAALAFARSRSCNWAPCAEMGGAVRSLPNRAHAFVRVVVHNKKQSWLSLLHVVDLAGSHPLAGHKVTHAFQPARGGVAESDRDRRALSQQLLSFSKVLTELAAASMKRAPGAAPQPAAQAVSSRDSKLTQMLTPLIACNAHVTLLAAVSPAAQHFLDTTNTLRLAARALHVRTCVMRTNVQGEDLAMLPMWKVLPPEALQLAKWSPTTTAEVPYTQTAECGRGPGSTDPRVNPPPLQTGFTIPRRLDDRPQYNTAAGPGPDAKSAGSESEIDAGKKSDTRPGDAPLQSAAGFESSAAQSPGASQQRGPTEAGVLAQIRADTSHALDSSGEPAVAAISTSPEELDDLHRGAISDDGGDRSGAADVLRGWPSRPELPAELSEERAPSPDTYKERESKRARAWAADTAALAVTELHGALPERPHQPDSLAALRGDFDQLFDSIVNPDGAHDQSAREALENRRQRADDPEDIASARRRESPEVRQLSPALRSLGVADDVADGEADEPPRRLPAWMADGWDGGESASPRRRSHASLRSSYAAPPAELEASPSPERRASPTPPAASESPLLPKSALFSDASRDGRFPRFGSPGTDAHATPEARRGEPADWRVSSDPPDPTLPRPFPSPGSAAYGRLSGGHAHAGGGPCSVSLEMGGSAALRDEDEARWGRQPMARSAALGREVFADERERGYSMLRVVQSETAALRQQNDTYLGMLKREKESSSAADRHRRDMEADMLELTTTYELKLDNLRLELAEARCQLRQMQSASGMAEVFEKFEADIGRLRSELRAAREQNSALARQVAAAELSQRPPPPDCPQTPPTAGGRSGCPDPASLHEGRFQNMRRQVRRLQLERDAAMEEVGVFQRKERAFALAKKQLEQATRRAQELERRLAAKEKLLFEQTVRAEEEQRRASDSDGRVATLVAERRELEARLEQVGRENASLQLQVQRLTSTKQRQELLDSLPTPPSAGRGRVGGASALLELCQQMQREHLQPKASALLDKLMKEIHFSLEEKRIHHEREKLLLKAMTGKR